MANELLNSNKFNLFRLQNCKTTSYNQLYKTGLVY